jgi:hypothetical protein
MLSEQEYITLLCMAQEEQLKACGCALCRARLLALRGLRETIRDDGAPGAERLSSDGGAVGGGEPEGIVWK